jgi:hypothetical protein
MGTTTPFGPDFVKELIPWLLKTFGEATAHAYRIIWNAFITLLLQHLILVACVLVLVLVAATVRAAITRRWGWLGSVLYNYLYFGTLFVIGLVWGPEIFANDYFEIALVILYIVCFSLVGVILTKTGLRRRY